MCKLILFYGRILSLLMEVLMNIKRFFVFTTAVFFAIFCYEFLIHSILFSSLYHQTAHLWRSMEDGGMYYGFMLVSQLAFSASMYFMYAKLAESKVLVSACHLGCYVGLVLGSVQIGTYMYMPIPLILTCGWVAASVGRGIVAGFVIDILTKKTA